MWKERQFFLISNNMMKAVILALVAAAVVLGAPTGGDPKGPSPVGPLHFETRKKQRGF